MPNAFSDFKIVSYQASKKAKAGRPSGGLIFLVKNHLNYEVLNLSPVWIILRVNTGERDCVFALVYFNPSSNISEQLEDFSAILNELMVKFPNAGLILGGDWNSRVGSENCSDELFFDETTLFKNRETNDVVVNTSGRKVIEFTYSPQYKMGLFILNGRTLSDRPAIVLKLA